MSIIMLDEVSSRNQPNPCSPLEFDVNVCERSPIPLEHVRARNYLTFFRVTTPGTSNGVDNHVNLQSV